MEGVDRVVACAPMRIAVFCLIVAVAGCVTTPPLPDLSHADEADALRARRALADNDFERALITEELATVELERARAANTVFAYRRFLEEFPIGREATTARKLLEALRFAEAGAENTPLAWNVFLSEHPQGEHATEARLRLGSLTIDALTGTDDLAGVRAALAQFPDHPRRGELVTLEDRLAFEAARREGLAQVQAYLSEHPMGSYRVEALDLAETLEREALLESGDLERARLRAASDHTGRFQEVVDELLLRDALAMLDRPALEKLAKDAVPAVRAQAQSTLTSWRRPPLPAAVAQASVSHGLRPLSALAVVLRRGDPLDRVAALSEAAEYGSWEAATLVLGAVDNRYVDVRLAVVTALRALSVAMPPASWRAFVEGREAEALVDALTPEPWRRVAALRDADGRQEAALAAWREVLRYDPEDLAASARVLELTRTMGDRLGQGAAARDLATQAALFGEGRWLQPHDPATPAVERRDGPGTTIGVPAEVTVLRQLCAAMSLTTISRDALAALRDGARDTEQQLYTLAITDADTALARMTSRRAELERTATRRGYPACGEDLLTPTLEKVHKERIEAIGKLAKSGDQRLLPFLSRLQHTPSAEVREAAKAAVRALSPGQEAPAVAPSR